jgi:predicted RNA-binding Zn-ribbon protein involved in translation (DUF1610 family)
MAKTSSSGKCNLCGGTFNKVAMGRHLTKCKGMTAATNSGNEVFHLRVQGGYRNVYWMHLVVPRQVTLKELDQFLRATWLECCGHLSAFTIAGRRYAAAPMEDVSDSGLEENSMDVPMRSVLRVGAKFLHEYDFGSTTELNLEVVGILNVAEKPEGIQILARNDAPQIACEECGENATQVCSQCLWQGSGWLCEDCAEDHDCGEEMCLPVVNSPRVGVCGYTG